MHTAARARVGDSPKDDTGPLHYVILHRRPTYPLGWVRLQSLEINLDESPSRWRGHAYKLPITPICVKTIHSVLS
jgi:hypothetical protein